MASIELSTPITTLSGDSTTVGAYGGKAYLIVNTASKCGLTPQYEGLQALHEQFGPNGLVILGFPCNQFGAQEPGSAEEIGSFCQINYGVTFPMHAKIDVNGDTAHPLFASLKSAKPGLLGSTRIKWNFTKFLVGPDGEVLKRYAPQTEPADLVADLTALLR